MRPGKFNNKARHNEIDKKNLYTTAYLNTQRTIHLMMKLHNEFNKIKIYNCFIHET